MPRLSRYQILQHVSPVLEKFFKEKGSKIYSQVDIDSILSVNKRIWMLAIVTTSENFVEFLMKKNIIKIFKIELPNRIVCKYVYGDITDYEIALSINKDSYCSHYTAMFLNGITENIPKNIYTNMEQSNKFGAQTYDLEQINIDKAFSRPMRTTNQIVEFNSKKVYLLNGKNVKNIGVTDFKVDNRTFKITNIERTLIDISVRPNYAGGTQEILDTYIKAKGKCSVNKLLSILKKMNFAYPYHQVIGFYLEKAGYSENVLKLVEKQEIKYNFYLTYQMKDKLYSERWKLYFPPGL